MNVLSSEKTVFSSVRLIQEFFDASSALAFEEEIKPLLTQDPRLVLDMSKVEFIDSSGLGALVSCLRQAHAIGGEIKLSSLGKPTRALLNYCEFIACSKFSIAQRKRSCSTMYRQLSP